VSRRLAAVGAAHAVLSEARETDLTDPRRTAALLGRMEAVVRELVEVLDEDQEQREVGR